MANNLFNDLLHINRVSKDLRNEDQFKVLINNFEKEYYKFTPKFEVQFKKPLSNKRIYYCSIIDNETIKQLNKCLSTFDKDSSEIHYKYLFHKFYKPFSNYLREINSFITENKLSENQFSTPTRSLNSDEAYIVFYLKANAILLFMELQERFQKYSDENILMQEEIHEVYFSENAPTNLYVQPYEGEIVHIKKSAIETKRFIAISGDLENRIENNKIISFSQIIAKPDNLARAEESLFSESIIDVEYNFINTKGNKMLLAAFIHQLISKQIINERRFPENKPILTRDITKFFALRYGNGSDADREFRNFNGTKRHKLKNIIDKNYWLDNIK